MHKLKVLVIYHADCYDGVAAAWVISHYFRDLRNLVDITYYPTAYGKEPPYDLLKAADMSFIVDYSYPKDVLCDVEQITGSLLVIDHHKSTKEACEDLPFCLFDMQRSGAGMAWDYFFGPDPRPWIINYIEDRDLWNWAYENSAEVLAYLDTLDLFAPDFHVFEGVYSTRIELPECIGYGKVVRRHIEKYNGFVLDRALRFIDFVDPQGTEYKHIPIINHSPVGISEVLAVAAQDSAFALGYCRIKDGSYKYSIRVSDHSDFDASALAALYGGGGHEKAAGFILDNVLEETHKH